MIEERGSHNCGPRPLRLNYRKRVGGEYHGKNKVQIHI